jgi:D-alanyl-lipoteichoic acid acyltransferase DltB (MBOAT superfamily)
LSTWFRDYLYIPLGGNRVVKWKWYYNLIITFLVSGFWHGANWTFIAWGLLHGSYLMLALLFSKFNSQLHRFLFGKFPLTGKVINVIITFVLVYFAWIFFRADSIQDASFIISKILNSGSELHMFELAISNFGVFSMMVSCFAIGILFLYEVMLVNGIINRNYFTRLSSTIILIIITMLLGVMGSKSFIYFQF